VRRLSSTHGFQRLPWAIERLSNAFQSLSNQFQSVWISIESLSIAFQSLSNRFQSVWISIESLSIAFQSLWIRSVVAGSGQRRSLGRVVGDLACSAGVAAGGEGPATLPAPCFTSRPET
jgi:hypothetical protein